MRISNFICASIFLIIFLSLNVLADPSRDVCKIISGNTQPTTNSQGPQGPAVVTLTNPIQISSTEAGFQNTACGVATFSAAAERSRVLDTTNILMTRANIINMCAVAGHLTATSAGSFDDYVNGLKIVLNRDPVNCYRLTIKRLNSYTALPILTPPSPTTRTIQNVQTVTFRPYNFRPSDIVDALQRVLTSGGVGLGGVHYDSANVAQEAHMFQPVSINPVPRALPNNQQKYDMKIYDPYFGTTHNVEIAFDTQRRIYSNIWVKGGTDLWFHLEELFILENLGPCANISNFSANDTNVSSTGGVLPRPVKGPSSTIPITSSTPTGPTTPIGCGLLNRIANTCQVNNACIGPNEYCSATRFCTCRTTVCGDGEKAPSEQCDDGNLIGGDGCSATCQLEGLCNGNVVLASQIECNPPGSVCMTDRSNFGISLGTCNNQCKCIAHIP